MSLSSIVKIYTPLWQPNLGTHGVGVGFFVGRNHILTCRHVVDREDRNEDESIRVMLRLRFREVEIVALSQINDLALLEIKGRGAIPLHFKAGIGGDDKIKLKTFDGLWRGTRRGVVLGNTRDGFGADIRTVRGQSGSPAVIGRFRNMRVVGMLRAVSLNAEHHDKTGFGYFIGVPEIKAFLKECL